MSSPYGTAQHRLRSRFHQACGRDPAYVWNAGAVTVHRIRYTGPPALAVGVATLLADADGVDMISSHQPLLVDD